MGREDLVGVLCREIARMTDAAGVRVQLYEQPGQPSSEFAYGELSSPAVELPIRVGSAVLGSISFTLIHPIDPATIVDVDGLVSVAGAALAAIAATTTARVEARRDPLTGLGNRRAFEEILGVLAAVPIARPLSLALVDLDDLKLINARDGHAGGDSALRALAGALTASTRPEDASFRIGGDEFALVVRGGAATTRGILARMRERTEAGGTSFSAGIAECERPSDVPSLVDHADAALFAAKREGKGQARLFEPGLLDALPAPLVTSTR